jgi:hypothetical protein
MSREAPRAADDRAHLRRLVFWRRAVVEGARWLYGALGLLLFFLALPALVGIVVVFDGPAWLIALVVGMIVLAGLAEGAYRLWREAESKLRTQRSAEIADALLYMKCTATGGGINVFVSERARARPTLPPDKQVQLAERSLPPAEEFDYHVAAINYEHDTQAQYKEKFAGDVFAIVVALREKGYIPESDLEWLNYPTDLEAMQRVGDRLWEIGRRIEPTHLKHQRK